MYKDTHKTHTFFFPPTILFTAKQHTVESFSYQPAFKEKISYPLLLHFVFWAGMRYVGVWGSFDILLLALPLYDSLSSSDVFVMTPSNDVAPTSPFGSPQHDLCQRAVGRRPARILQAPARPSQESTRPVPETSCVPLSSSSQKCCSTCRLGGRNSSQ